MYFGRHFSDSDHCAASPYSFCEDSIIHPPYMSPQSASAGLSNNLLRSSIAVIFKPVIFISESNTQFPFGIDGMSVNLRNLKYGCAHYDLSSYTQNL